MNQKCTKHTKRQKSAGKSPADWKKRKALWQRPKCFVVNEWSERAFKPIVSAALPAWDQVAGWRGKLVAVCAYEASYTAPNLPVWNEGYPVWWHLTNLRLLDEPIPCRGNVGMWQLPKEVANLISP